MEGWRSCMPAADGVAEWVIAPDLMTALREPAAPAHVWPLTGLAVHASAACPPGYAVGRDAQGRVVKILGPKKVITLKPLTTPPWGLKE